MARGKGLVRYVQRRKGDLVVVVVGWSFGVNAHRVLSVRLRDLRFILGAMRN